MGSRSRHGRPGAHRDGHAAAAKRRRGRLEDGDDMAPCEAVRQRPLTRDTTAHEIRDLLLQWLVSRNLRYDDVAVTNDRSVLAELRTACRLRDRFIARALVEHLQLFVDG